MVNNGMFQRTQLLIGDDNLQRLSSLRVLLFGVGGVGSWCAEGLVRSGVGALTMVDPDVVCLTNINRQLPALTSTIGEAKVEVMARRLLDINPALNVAAMQDQYTPQSAERFDFSQYDVIIDAIDSLSDKAHLIINATASGKKFYSSMGAALKMDPTKISVAEFWKVSGCPLAAALRRRFKKSGVFPRRKFKCVYSPELVKNRGGEVMSDGSMTFKKVAVNGTFPTTVAIFGLTLANIALTDSLK